MSDLSRGAAAWIIYEEELTRYDRTRAPLEKITLYVPVN